MLTIKKCIMLSQCFLVYGNIYVNVKTSNLEL